MRAELLGLTLLLGLFGCSSAGGAGGDPEGTSGGGGSDTIVTGGAGGEDGEGGEGGGGGTGGSISLGGQGSGGQKECQSKETPGKRIPASILIVLDRSGSMKDNGKWTGAKAALNQMLTTADPELGMGLLNFPNDKNSGCNLLDPCGGIACEMDFSCKQIPDVPDVPIGPLKQQSVLIQNKIATTSPNGSATPTLPALQKAYAYMQKLQTDSERFVLLVTDGEPTFAMEPFGCIPASGLDCGNKQLLGKATLEARQGNPQVRTFVIGAPGSEEGQEILSGLAHNGGTCKPGGSHSNYSCHYQVGSANFEQELATTLTYIAGSVSNCTYAVPVPENGEADPELVNVIVTTSEGEKTIYKDSNQQDGWDYTDDSKTKVQIFGPECEAINKGTEAKVKIALGCKTQVK